MVTLSGHVSLEVVAFSGSGPLGRIPWPPMNPNSVSRRAPGPPTWLKNVSACPCGDDGGLVAFDAALREDGVLSSCGRGSGLSEVDGTGGGLFERIELGMYVDVEATPGGAGAPLGAVALGCSTKANLQTGQVPLLLSQVVIQSS